jgi:hypothetical protein
LSQAPEAETAALKLAEERLDEVSAGAQTLLEGVAYIDGTGYLPSLLLCHYEGTASRTR